MWRPRTWSEVQALKGQAEESPSLDFKKAVTTKNEDIATDIAAMTVNGGVLLYGVDGDKQTRVATEITPVPLNGLEERLRSIAGSRISPAPDFDFESIVQSEGNAEGVVAVVVPPSPLAPHQVNGRYPCRKGSDERCADGSPRSSGYTRSAGCSPDHHRRLMTCSPTTSSPRPGPTERTSRE